MVGTTNTGESAPYNDLSWEIWGVSCRRPYVTRATRWFELHRLAGEPDAWAQAWRDEIRKFSHDIELWMMYPEMDLGPNIVQYPYDSIVSRFGTYFMTSTFSWMMAQAIDELRPMRDGKIDFSEHGEISIFGVEMEYGSEYAQQRSGFRHYIDLARFLGIPVTRIASGGLAYEPVPYPMWQDDPLIAKLELRLATTKKTLDQRDNTRIKTQRLIGECNRLTEELIRISKDRDYDVQKRIAEVEKERANLLQTSAELSCEIVQNRGAYEELSWMRNFLEP